RVLQPLPPGALFHGVQFGILERLRDSGLLPVRPEALAQVLDVVDEVLEAEATRAEEALAPAIPRVWADEIDSLRADLREWLRRQADDGRWVPERFELAFGLPASERERRDPASVTDPVTVPGGLVVGGSCALVGGRGGRDPASVTDPVTVAGILMLRGSVDLVERSADGSLRITDHKTGKAWVKDGVVVGGGQVLQPLLYALACERILAGRVT